MKFEVFIPKDGAWVHAKILAPLTMDQSLKFLKKAAQQANKEWLHRILIDSRGVPNLKGYYNDYEIAYKHLNKLGFKYHSRVAVLVAPGDKSYDFMELVAKNAGFRWRVFSDEQEATEWLQQDPKLNGSGGSA